MKLVHEESVAVEWRIVGECDAEVGGVLVKAEAVIVDDISGLADKATHVGEELASGLIQLVRRGRLSGSIPAETYLFVLGLRARAGLIALADEQEDVREAREAGATWEQIAAARRVPEEAARAEFHEWVVVQAAYWDDSSEDLDGLCPQERAAALALLD